MAMILITVLLLVVAPASLYLIGFVSKKFTRKWLHILGFPNHQDPAA